MRLLENRKPGASICPSEAARALFGEEEWREQMPLVRKVANELCQDGQLEICQKGIAVDPAIAKGPVRLRIPSD